MSVQENKNIVREFYESGNRGDMDTVVDLLADDVRWTNMGTTSLSGVYEGKAELMEKLIGPLFGRLKQGIHMDIELLVAEGDHVVAVTSGSSETLDGRPYNNNYCWIIRIRDGKLAEVTEYSDTELITSVFG